MPLQNLTDENFSKNIKESGKASIVQFSADWCSPCRTLKPIMEEKSLQDCFYKLKKIQKNI